MMTLLLMLSSVAGSSVANSSGAGQNPPGVVLPPARLVIACITTDCAARAAGDTFRVPRDARREQTSKDRAIRADGSYCSVVGAKRCTSRGRTIFSTDFGE